MQNAQSRLTCDFFTDEVVISLASTLTRSLIIKVAQHRLRKALMRNKGLLLQGASDCLFASGKAVHNFE